MALRIRRGTDAQRSGRTFELGELVYTIDSQQLWVGDGVTAGGAPVVGSNVAGYGLTYNNITKQLEVSGLTSDDITEGTNNKYFSTELAVDAVGAALVAGNDTNVGITFTYASTQDEAGRINATIAFDGIGLTDIVNDESPQLGGELDLNQFDITGEGNIDVIGDITSSGIITAAEYGFINAKQITLTDSTVGTIANAGFVLSTEVGGSSGSDFFAINSYHNDADPIGAFYYRARGTVNTPLSLQNGDGIFNFAFTGRTSDGSSGVAVGLGAEVDGTIDDGILPGKFVVYTAESSGAFTLKLSVGSDGMQTIKAPALVAGTNPGEVDTGTISSWMKVNFNGVDYAVPMYAIRT